MNNKTQKTLTIIVIAVVAVAILLYYHPLQSTPQLQLVTYHIGDSIDNYYILSGLQGTGDGSNTVYAIFSIDPLQQTNPPLPFALQRDVSDNTPFTLGSHQYVIVSSGSDYIVMQEVTPMPM